jgi:outer membrane protein assembly factor BamE
MLRILVLCSALFLLTACAYRPDITQGNFLEEEDVGQVEIGMTRSQVRYVLGTPMLRDPFRSDRWDYHYVLDTRHAHRKVRRDLTILFDEQGRVREIVHGNREG